jgi:integrase
MTVGQVAVNPCVGLKMPAVDSKRDRIAPPEEAAALLAALPAGDKALWATAMYAGLRCGELLALRIEDVDLAAGIIRVEHGWDPKRGSFRPRRASPGECRSRPSCVTTSMSIYCAWVGRRG